MCVCSKVRDLGHLTTEQMMMMIMMYATLLVQCVCRWSEAVSGQSILYTIVPSCGQTTEKQACGDFSGLMKP